jgi:hypothetical protein
MPELSPENLRTERKDNAFYSVGYSSEGACSVRVVAAGRAFCLLWKHREGTCIEKAAWVRSRGS